MNPITAMIATVWHFWNP